MPSANAELGVRATLKAELFNRELKNLERNVESSTGQVNKSVAKQDAVISSLTSHWKEALLTVGTFAGVAAVVSKVTSELSKSIDEARRLQKTLYEVSAVGGFVGRDMEAIALKIRELGAATAFTAQQAASGAKILSLAGFDAREILAGLPPILDLAVAGVTDLSTATDVAASSLRSFGLDASEMERVANVLTATFTNSNTTVETLAETFRYGAVAFKQAGYDIEILSAAAAALGDRGLKGSMAGTSLAFAIKGLSAPSSDAKAKLDELGITTVTADGRLRDLADIVDSFNEKMKGMTEIERYNLLMQTFGERGVRGFSILLDTGAQKLREFTRELRNSGDVAKDVAERQLQSLEGRITIMNSAIAGLREEIGRRFLPILSEGADTAARFASELTEVLRSDQERITSLKNRFSELAAKQKLTHEEAATLQRVYADLLRLVPNLRRNFVELKDDLSNLAEVQKVVNERTILWALQKEAREAERSLPAMKERLRFAQEMAKTLEESIAQGPEFAGGAANFQRAKVNLAAARIELVTLNKEMENAQRAVDAYNAYINKEIELQVALDRALGYSTKEVKEHKEWVGDLNEDYAHLSETIEKTTGTINRFSAARRLLPEDFPRRRVVPGTPEPEPELMEWGQLDIGMLLYVLSTQKDLTEEMEKQLAAEREKAEWGQLDMGMLPYVLSTQKDLTEEREKQLAAEREKAEWGQLDITMLPYILSTQKDLTEEMEKQLDLLRLYQTAIQLGYPTEDVARAGYQPSVFVERWLKGMQDANTQIAKDAYDKLAYSISQATASALISQGVEAAIQTLANRIGDVIGDRIGQSIAKSIGGIGGGIAGGAVSAGFGATIGFFVDAIGTWIENTQKAGQSSESAGEKIVKLKESIEQLGDRAQKATSEKNLDELSRLISEASAQIISLNETIRERQHLEGTGLEWQTRAYEQLRDELKVRIQLLDEQRKAIQLLIEQELAQEKANEEIERSVEIYEYAVKRNKELLEQEQEEKYRIYIEEGERFKEIAIEAANKIEEQRLKEVEAFEEARRKRDEQLLAEIQKLEDAKRASEAYRDALERQRQESLRQSSEIGARFLRTFDLIKEGITDINKYGIIFGKEALNLLAEFETGPAANVISEAFRRIGEKVTGVTGEGLATILEEQLNRIIAEMQLYGGGEEFYRYLGINLDDIRREIYELRNPLEQIVENTDPLKNQMAVFDNIQQSVEDYNKFGKTFGTELSNILSNIPDRFKADLEITNEELAEILQGELSRALQAFPEEFVGVQRSIAELLLQPLEAIADNTDPKQQIDNLLEMGEYLRDFMLGGATTWQAQMIRGFLESQNYTQLLMRQLPTAQHGTGWFLSQDQIGLLHAGDITMNKEQFTNLISNLGGGGDLNGVREVHLKLVLSPHDLDALVDKVVQKTEFEIATRRG